MTMPVKVSTRCSMESSTSDFCMAGSFLHFCMSFFISSSTSKKRLVIFFCASEGHKKAFAVVLKKAMQAKQERHEALKQQLQQLYEGNAKHYLHNGQLLPPPWLTNGITKSRCGNTEGYMRELSRILQEKRTLAHELFHKHGILVSEW